MASQDNPHSNGYYVMLVLAVVIGVVLGIGIFIWIWANISGNTLLENMMDHAGESVYADLKKFTEGESIEKYISDGTTIKSLLSSNDEI